MTKIDPVTLSILVNNLKWVAEEMNEYLCQAAFSTNIKVRRDCSCALYTREGRIIAQGEFMPIHLGIMAGTLKEILKEYPADTIKEGDTFIHNDPFRMGSHLWDVMLFSPIFYDGVLVGFAGNLAHHVDIGGAPVVYGLETIFEEGLRLPPIKLYKEGVLQEDIVNIIINNVRTPYEAKGDIAAQTAANYRGQLRIKELAAKYGPQALIDYMDAIIHYSEKGMRKSIAELPDCTVEFEDYIEHDGIQECYKKLKVKLTVKGDELFVDFDGTDSANAGPVNCPWSLTCSSVYYAVKAVLGINIPTNEGAYHPINLIRPEKESLVDARYPHAINLCTNNPSQRVVDAVIGAFSKIVPEQTCACDGHWVPGRYVGTDTNTGRVSAFVETYAAGRGAKYNEDGADAHQTHLSNTSNAPIEIIELEHPLRVHSYQMVPDSGGAGRFRGGVGVRRELIALQPMAASVSRMRYDRVPPYGLYGGNPGKSDFCAVLLPDGEPPQICKNVQPGTHMVCRSSGGGGWGNPLERDFHAVEQDVLEGYISIDAARRDYKVVIDPATLKVDQAATKALREAE